MNGMRGRIGQVEHAVANSKVVDRRLGAVWKREMAGVDGAAVERGAHLEAARGHDRGYDFGAVCEVADRDPARRTGTASARPEWSRFTGARPDLDLGRHRVGGEEPAIGSQRDIGRPQTARVGKLDRA